MLKVSAHLKGQYQQTEMVSKRSVRHISLQAIFRGTYKLMTIYVVDFECLSQRKRIKTEEKAKVVTTV